MLSEKGSVENAWKALHFKKVFIKGKESCSVTWRVNKHLYCTLEMFLCVSGFVL